MDLGTDVSPAKFVDAVRTERPDLLGMSALLTTTMPTMKATIEELKEAGLRDQVEVLVRGTLAGAPPGTPAGAAGVDGTAGVAGGAAGVPADARAATSAQAENTARGAAAENAAPMTILHICGDTSHLVKSMCATGAQGLSLDSPVDLARAAREADPETVLIGNIDPVRVMVQETPEGVRRAVRALLDSMEPHENFILSTGCDLPYETPFENIDAFMREGRL